ncbi:hypothetical protein HOO65_040543 [Ceratocystis lukuohia]|uniref:DH domain-containing protein n=1 Tax=Ceratocystis lukuohia TaxID=2019550 RepID=A0ABR4MIX1_9PEZI
MESSTPNTSTEKPHDPATPKKVPAKTNVTPKSAPAAAGGTRGRPPVRRIDTLPPSLLTDFFLGRPSPARRAALKARRESMDAIKAELRQEMRAEAVRKVQPPGGVRDRVRKWQKSNAAAMAAGDPQIPPSEPGDVAFESDDHSVTEEDRIRIRSQPQKRTSTSRRPSAQKSPITPKRAITPKAKRGSQPPDLNHGSRSLPSKINQPPKKRVVSDDHWMKIKLKKKPSHRRKSPNTTQRIPKDFTHKTMNPPAVSKVRDWVNRVEIPDASPTSPPMSPKSRSVYRNHKHSQSMPNAINKNAASHDGTESESGSESASESTSSDNQDDHHDNDARSTPSRPLMFDDESVHVKPLRMSLKKTPAPSAVSVPDDDGIRVRGSEIHDDVISTPHSEPNDGIRVIPSEPFGDDGIRVTPSEPIGGDGIRVAASEPGGSVRVRPSAIDDDGIRVRGSELDDDGIRVCPVLDPLDNDDQITSLQEAEDALSSMLGTSIIDRNYNDQSRNNARKISKSKPLNSKSPASGTAKLPVREKPQKTNRTNGKVSGKPAKSRSGRRRTRSLGPPAIRSVRTCSFSTGSSVSESDDGLSEIPVGNSAFSVLELPLSEEAHKPRNRQSQPSPARPPMFRDVPNVFKKIMSEGKKILQEVHEPAKAIPAKQSAPVRIENWLSGTVEPKIENETAKVPIKKAIEKEWAQESQIRKSSVEYRPGKHEHDDDAENPIADFKAEAPMAFKKGDDNKEKDKRREMETARKEKEREQEKTPKKQTPPKDTIATPTSPDAAPKVSKITPADSRSPAEKEKKPAGGLQRKPTGLGRPKIASKSPTSRKPLKDALRDAFRGESVGHNLPPATYQSQEDRAYEVEVTAHDESIDDEWESQLRPHTSPTESDFSYDSRIPYETRYADSIITDSDMTPAPLRRRAPPTNDNLSSVVTSDEAVHHDPDSSHTTDLSNATPAQTNLTQATSVGNEQSKSEREAGVRRQPSYISSSDTVNRKPSVLSVARPSNRNPSNISGACSFDENSSFLSDRNTLNRNPSFVSGPDTIDRNHSFASETGSQKRGASKASSARRSTHKNGSHYSHRTNSSSGLKRKLTKHSDLVSVLSMPEEEDMVSTLTGTQSRTSRRTGSQNTIREKRASGPVQGPIAALLRDFADEETSYARELKSLVDGVVPVLLKEVLHWDGKAPLFGDPSVKGDIFSKSVVDMGICLEKMRNSHKKAPLMDIYQLFAWLERVHPIYDSYLDAWRLGFHDIVVNLAPLINTLDDTDSLLDAMPRNDEGDLVDADGARLDVAHFLKRPLQRIKRMVKFLKGVTKALPSATTTALLESYNQLQDKARRRYNEEIARITDKDAVETDTSQCLNLQTMEKMESVTIDPLRQVNAKDVFSLTLWHSNGQRLECQAELVHRDRPQVYGDPGDLLIRKTDGEKETWLLFAPITMDYVSARQDEFGIMVMIRGPIAYPLPGEGQEWYELLHLRTEDELQVEDWISIFNPSPIPAFNRRRVVPGSISVAPPIAPPQLSTIMEASTEISSVSEISTPSKDIIVKVKSRRGRSPNTSEVGKHETSQSDEQKPRNSSSSPEPEAHSSGSDVTVKNEPSDDKPPAPPVHRTLSKSSTPVLAPPEPLRRGVERRGSSPLKHEYLPSEVSSETSGSADNESEKMYSDPEDDESIHSGSGSRTGSEDESYTESESSGDEIDSIDMPETELGISIRDEERQREFRAATASVMTYDTITPSHSASQVGSRDEYHKGEEEEAEQVAEIQDHKFISKVSQWSDKKAIWKDLKAENCWVVVHAGCLEVHHMGVEDIKVAEPLVALDLTPLILLRQSTFIDLEIRAETLDTGSIFARHGANFRFRCQNTAECYDLYAAVHNARLQNERYTRKQDELRIKSFGQNAYPMSTGAGDDGANNSHETANKGWFGRRNSYRASTRAPTQSQAMSQSQDGASTTPSSNASAASSFLRRLTGGNLSFNLAKSSVNHHVDGGPASLYSADSSRGGPGLRAPSLSMASQSTSKKMTLDSDAIRIRLHLLITQSKWEDWGNCMLTISRPPPGKHMSLRRYHGLEKRVTVSTIPKKNSGEKPAIIIDAVLGSGCFTPMGNRGVVCGIWEEVKDEKGVVGNIPQNGNAAGNITKWCFQCKNGVEAQWVLRNLHQEVELF